MMEIAEVAVVILVATLRAGTPLVLAALGELVAEKAGVLNLGVEGMMLVGAVAAVIATLGTGSYALGAVAGTAAGLALSLVFGHAGVTAVAAPLVLLILAWHWRSGRAQPVTPA